MKPKIVVITQFEPTNGEVGEFTLFRDRFAFRPISDARLPGELYADPENNLLGIVAGVGAVQTATRITALGMDSRFDLSESLWLISGIGGGDPARTPLGSPVLADWCVDGDLAWEIDGRELPAGWPTGLLPLGAKTPYVLPSAENDVFGPLYESVRLPTQILDWAQARVNTLPLAGSEAARDEGARYRECPTAAEPPRVFRGTTLSAVRFWHGHLMNDWANRWVDLFTGGQSQFHTSNMEDSGTLFALRFLARLGRANAQRILVIRSVSNFTRPPDGESAASTLVSEEGEVHFPGIDLAHENGFRVAQQLINAWLAGDLPPDPEV